MEPLGEVPTNCRLVIKLQEMRARGVMVLMMLALTARSSEGQRAPCYECEMYKDAHPHSNPYKEIRSHCVYPCGCPSPPQCDPGVPLVRDGCGCCWRCARQEAQDCDSVRLCDSSKNLVCVYKHDTAIIGTCQVVMGAACRVNDTTYGDGKSFKLDCRTQCTCKNGIYACVSLCPGEAILPSPQCHHPHLLDVPGQCCREWVCDKSPDKTVGPPRCERRFGPWSSCSAPCGRGLSRRWSTDNPECRPKTETRLCQVRACDIVSQGLVQGHHIRRGHTCKATVRSSRFVRLRIGRCLSERQFKPKVCGTCLNKCCKIVSSTTIKVAFNCPLQADSLPSTSSSYSAPMTSAPSTAPYLSSSSYSSSHLSSTDYSKRIPSLHSYSSSSPSSSYVPIDSQSTLKKSAQEEREYSDQEVNRSVWPDTDKENVYSGESEKLDKQWLGHDGGSREYEDKKNKGYKEERVKEVETGSIQFDLLNTHHKNGYHSHYQGKRNYRTDAGSQTGEKRKRDPPRSKTNTAALVVERAELPRVVSAFEMMDEGQPVSDIFFSSDADASSYGVRWKSSKANSSNDQHSYGTDQQKYDNKDNQNIYRGGRSEYDIIEKVRQQSYNRKDSRGFDLTGHIFNISRRSVLPSQQPSHLLAKRGVAPSHVPHFVLSERDASPPPMLRPPLQPLQLQMLYKRKAEQPFVSLPHTVSTLESAKPLSWTMPSPLPLHILSKRSTKVSLPSLLNAPASPSDIPRDPEKSSGRRLTIFEDMTVEDDKEHRHIVSHTYETIYHQVEWVMRCKCSQGPCEDIGGYSDDDDVYDDDDYYRNVEDEDFFND